MDSFQPFDLLLIFVGVLLVVAFLVGFTMRFRAHGILGILGFLIRFPFAGAVALAFSVFEVWWMDCALAITMIWGSLLLLSGFFTRKGYPTFLEWCFLARAVVGLIKGYAQIWAWLVGNGSLFKFINPGTLGFVWEEGTDIMSASIYGKCPSCHRFTLTGEEKRFGGSLRVRFFACYMCGYQDNSLDTWHDPSLNDPIYSHNAGT